MIVRSFEDVRQTMIEYDRAHPGECPVDKRQAEREAEEQTKAHEAQQKKQASNNQEAWDRYVDSRIERHAARRAQEVGTHDNAPVNHV
jgi:hypothetical protein